LALFSSQWHCLFGGKSYEEDKQKPRMINITLSSGLIVSRSLPKALEIIQLAQILNEDDVAEPDVEQKQCKQPIKTRAKI